MIVAASLSCWSLPVLDAATRATLTDHRVATGGADARRAHRHHSVSLIGWQEKFERGAAERYDAALFAITANLDLILDAPRAGGRLAVIGRIAISPFNPPHGIIMIEPSQPHGTGYVSA